VLALSFGQCEGLWILQCRAQTLIVASAADRLLPSLEESGRLVRLIPNARRVILPNSGHTALLESGISLAEIMGRTGFLPEVG
jgi:pimeloyl-ACP methyl ester carboxylesterase